MEWPRRCSNNAKFLELLRAPEMFSWDAFPFLWDRVRYVQYRAPTWLASYRCGSHSSSGRWRWVVSVKRREPRRDLVEWWARRLRVVVLSWSIMLFLLWSFMLFLDACFQWSPIRMLYTIWWIKTTRSTSRTSNLLCARLGCLVWLIRLHLLPLLVVFRVYWLLTAIIPKKWE